MNFSKLSDYCKLSDEELMAYSAEGHEEAFLELYNRYSKKILFFFHKKLGQDKAKSEDFLQDLFLKIIEKGDQFDREKKFSTWLYTLAYNMCKNEYRREDYIKEHKLNLDELHIEYQDSSGLHEQDWGFFKAMLSNELESMDEKKSMTFVLRHQQHLSIKQISDIMECSEGTVKSRLFYTVKLLASRLRKLNIMSML